MNARDRNRAFTYSQPKHLKSDGLEALLTFLWGQKRPIFRGEMDVKIVLGRKMLEDYGRFYKTNVDLWKG